jgi:hypothetical protein
MVTLSPHASLLTLWLGTVSPQRHTHTRTHTQTHAHTHTHVYTVAWESVTTATHAHTHTHTHAYSGMGELHPFDSGAAGEHAQNVFSIDRMCWL